ncbi:MAG TPA: hypothetical protein VGJ39_05295 [Vicinamibacterales bacterium]|jgi:hypothetical protein
MVSDHFRHAILSSILFLAIVSPLTAQGPFPPPKTPPAKSAVRDSQSPVVVTGCLSGSRLKIDRTVSNPTVDSLGASEFVMEGPKELLQQIRREHDGHQDEITGIAIVPASRTDEGKTETKQLGKKTRITVGARTTVGERLDGPRPVRLKVASLRHIDDKCSFAS